MLRFRKMRLTLALPVLLAALMPVLVVAQDDPNDVPLGDVARSVRRKTPPPKDVIDNDNLSKVMDQAESRHPWGAVLKVLTGGSSASRVPNVTCSLSFSMNAKTLFPGQYAQMELPPGEVIKLEGPATIEGNALTVAVFNGTNWHVSEVAVALTIVKKTEASDAPLYDPAAYSGPHSGVAKLAPAVGSSPAQESEVRPEKKPDVTVIYHLRAAAPPAATTVFSAPLNLELAPDQEWHWAIVQAKGYPPQYAIDIAQATAQSSEPASLDPSIPALAAPQNTTAASPTQNPQ